MSSACGSEPLKSLEQAIAERAGASPRLEDPSAGPVEAAIKIAAGRRRPLTLRFARGASSVALVRLGEAASLPEDAADELAQRHSAGDSGQVPRY